MLEKYLVKRVYNFIVHEYICTSTLIFIKNFKKFFTLCEVLNCIFFIVLHKKATKNDTKSLIFANKSTSRFEPIFYGLRFAVKST